MQSLLSGTLKGWFEQFGHILAEPLTGRDGSEWGVKLEVLRLLTLLAGRFTRVSAPHMPSIMAHTWQLFVGEALQLVISVCNHTVSDILHAMIAPTKYRLGGDNQLPSFCRNPVGRIQKVTAVLVW